MGAKYIFNNSSVLTSKISTVFIVLSKINLSFKIINEGSSKCRGKSNLFLSTGNVTSVLNETNKALCVDLFVK